MIDIKLQNNEWYSKSWKEVLSSFETSSSDGLSDQEVTNRRKLFGYNKITAQKKQSVLIRFLSQFNNPLIYILLASALVTGMFKDGLVDASIIAGVVLINAIIGFIQENKAEKSIQALSNSLATLTTVMRDGRLQEIDSVELVPGDIIILKSGNKVPADIRLFHSKDLQISEAILTGESVSAEKNADIQLGVDTVLGDRATMAYAGTLVTFGQGTGIVVSTSDYTEVGKISHLLRDVVSLATPLTEKFAKFSVLIAYAIMALAVITFIIGLLRGISIYETLLESIALAVAVIPEGLPAAVTITLAIGVSRMAKRKAIIRKLPAVEVLGTVTVICSDKTGTLTQNEMMVTNIYTSDSAYEVSGSGYSPAGSFLADGLDIPIENNKAFTSTLLCGVLCNDSRVVTKEEKYMVEGDPTEGALHVSAMKCYKLSDMAGSHNRIDTIPFESLYQYMAVLTTTKDNHRNIWVKGSVEAILKLCNSQMNSVGEIADINKKAIQEKAANYARNGLRVLAFAYTTKSDDSNIVHHNDLEQGLVFTGLQAMIDPPREEVKYAIKQCQTAGIEVKMITGDHILTASAIAAQLGIGTKTESGFPKAIDGTELKRLTDEMLEERLKDVSVFARVAPEEKLRIVRLLQHSNNIVAMTGDGVNDAPALKQANIGIAMGVTGTDVSKEAADIVLTDDNFASIHAAVEEGRGVFDNLQKIIMWTLPVNLGIGLIILASIIFNLEIPILPVQILWINMTTAGVLGLALALEPKEPSSMKRPPLPKDAPILSLPIAIQTILIGIFIAGISYSSFLYEIFIGAPIREAQTISVNVVVFASVAYLFNCRSKGFSLKWKNLFTNWVLWPSVILMVLLQIFFSNTSLFHKLFKTQTPDMDSWMRCLAGAVFFWIIVELYKIIARQFEKKRD